jgi:hypothetical protein
MTFGMSGDGKAVVWDFSKRPDPVTKGVLKNRQGTPAGTIVNHPKNTPKHGEPMRVLIRYNGDDLKAEEVAYSIQTKADFPMNHKVLWKDGDPTNNHISNLVLVKI